MPRKKWTPPNQRGMDIIDDLMRQGKIGPDEPDNINVSREAGAEPKSPDNQKIGWHAANRINRDRRRGCLGEREL